MPERIFKINELIKRELSQIILREADFPNTLITITRVETSERANHAKVYISVMPEAQSKRVLKVLHGLSYSFQQELNERLTIRPPKIKFVEEGEIAKAAKIEELLKEIKTLPK